jgi:hypothetical protein
MQDSASNAYNALWGFHLLARGGVSCKSMQVHHKDVVCRKQEQKTVLLMYQAQTCLYIKQFVRPASAASCAAQVALLFVRHCMITQSAFDG